MFHSSFKSKASLLAACSACALVLGAPAFAQDVTIIQPGAPGEDVRTLSADEAIDIAANQYSEADVKFMQDMIWHHFQATEMADLVADRTNDEGVVDIASRINVTQADEIEFMQGWLTDRGQDAPNPAGSEHSAGHHAHHGGHAAHHTMAGMATPEQMAQLAASNGTEFDALFLELMIAHHDGAVIMVDNLLRTSGSAFDPVLFDFINDVRGEQQSEIRRMAAMLTELTADPRSGLAPGFRDAGEAIRNLSHVSTQPKPTGFFDAENPAGLRPEIEDEDADEDADPRFGSRFPFLSFSNTDMAFSGNLMAVGNYHGFNLYELGDAQPDLIASVVCPGGQGDVSIVGDLLIMSVEQTRGRRDCGREGISEDASPDRFRGVRIFDISNPRAPRQVGQVQTCRGSHTHSVVSNSDGRIIVYNSGTSSVRPEEELEGCIGAVLGDDRTALFSIDVIEIPVDNPAASRIIDSPRVFADDETGQIAGLWQGGNHGEGTQRTSRTDQCHDITVFPSLQLAAGACSGNGILLDISDPRQPRRIDAVVDEGFAYWHSATFNNDGTKVIFTDEWGGGGRPRCRAQDPQTWGADAIYDIVDGELVFEGYYKLPGAQSDEENCVAHNGSAVPVPGRDIFVQAWYQGGLSVIDFTDSANATEIAFFDRGPIDEHQMVTGGFWSTYWYDGRIYGTEIVRGLDVFELEPSEFLTANEIAAAALGDQGETFNPQQQFPVTWPDHPVVALAYIDQLQRSDVLSDELEGELRTALGSALTHVEAGTEDRGLSRTLSGLADDLPRSAEGDRDDQRLEALRDTLDGVAGELR